MGKGFTLVELLAVIVLLAIIALIATPIVLGIIDDAKESAMLRSAEFYLDSVLYSVVKQNIKEEKKFEKGTCAITNGNLDCNGMNVFVDVDGEVPSSGTITFNGKRITEVTLEYSTGTIVMNQYHSLEYEDEQESE